MGTLGSGNPGGVDRRSLIKKALTAGGVGYVAPLILGTATPASAQVVSASCPGPSCAQPSTCGDGLVPPPVPGSTVTFLQFNQATFNSPWVATAQSAVGTTTITATDVPVAVTFDPSFCLVAGCGGLTNGTYFLNFSATTSGGNDADLSGGSHHAELQWDVLVQDCCWRWWDEPPDGQFHRRDDRERRGIQPDTEWLGSAGYVYRQLCRV